MTPSPSIPDSPCIRTLDPCTLGQPVHLLDAFAERLRERLDTYFTQHFNRRFDGTYRVSVVSVPSTAPIEADATLRRFHANGLHFTVGIDRALLIQTFTDCYGEDDAVTHRSSATPSATEARFASRLANDWLTVYVNTLMGDAAVPLASEADINTHVEPASGECMSLRVTVAHTTSDRHSTLGAITFALAESQWPMLLNCLASPAERVEAVTQKGTVPCDISRVPVRLCARLVTLNMPLGQLLDLHPGMTLPITLNTPATVHIGDARVLHAKVVERDAHLCLTAFETLE